MAEPTTASEAKKYYDPLPTQYIKFNSNIYCYNFSKLKNIQMMLAEEKAQLKKMRLDAFSENTHIPDTQMDMEYVAELVSILFVPAPNKKPKVFSRESMKTTKNDFLDDDSGSFDKAERCLRDFFTRRGKRLIVSTTLMRNGGSDRMISRMMERAASTFSKSPSSTKGSITPGNTTEESKPGSETQPSGS